MQQQFETEEKTENEFATKYRVTPQELTEAVTRVELRHAAAMNETADTLTLGEAVEQLHLAMSPEELLEEVRLLRENAKASAATQEKLAAKTASKAFALASIRIRRWKLGLLTFAILGVPSLIFFLMLPISRFLLSSHERQVSAPMSAIQNGVEAMTFKFGEMKDDQIFTMSTQGIMAIANKPNNAMPVSSAPYTMPNSKFVWRVVKWRGETFVLGSVEKPVTEAALDSGSFDLRNFYEDPTANANFNGMQQVRIPVQRFRDVSTPPTHYDVGGVDEQIVEIPALEK